jgi:hypothetical protein
MHSHIELSKSPCGATHIIARIFLLPLVASCGSSPTPGAENTPVGNVVFKDANNYSATSVLTIPQVQTTPATDLKICWDGISTDLLCHSVTVASMINSVTFVQLINFSEAKVQVALGTGQDFTRNALMAGTYTIAAGETCANLSAFDLYNSKGKINPALNYVAGSDKTYMLLFSQCTTVGMGAKSVLFLEPADGSQNTTVNAPVGCGIVNFTPDIASPAQLSLPKGGPWVLDWSLLTKTGLGGKVNFASIDSLMLGYYDGMTVAQIQSRFLDLQIMTTTTYTATLSKGQNHVDLGSAKDTTGVAFAGFTPTNSTWVAALLCSTCVNPAPVALTILNPS